MINIIRSSLAICFPFLFTLWLIIRFKTHWNLFWAGVGVSLVTDVIYTVLLIILSNILKINHFPFPPITINVIYAVLTSLLASFTMESLRWVGFKRSRDKEYSYGASLTYATGFGSIGMVAMGIMGFLTVMASRSINTPIGNFNFINNMYNPCATGSQPALQTQSFFEKMIAEYNVFLFILVPISLHFALSVMIGNAIARKKAQWFVAAIIWHIFVNGPYIFITQSGGISNWTLSPMRFPAGVGPIVFSILLALDFAFVVWSCKKFKVGELSSSKDKIEQIPIT